MNPVRAVVWLFALAVAVDSHGINSAASVADSLSRITLDPAKTFRVRDLHLRRGDVAFYFTDGLLSFATEVNGKRVAAVFTTSGVEAGDAELLVLPPQPAERQSLAEFAHTPNLDEHFFSAILYFTDATGTELLSQIGEAEPPTKQEVDPKFRSAAERILRHASAEVRTRMVASILDPDQPENGFFFAGVQGREVGALDVLYDPTASEPVTVGRVSADTKGELSNFELWTNYRPRNARPYHRPAPVLSAYAIDAAIQPDLSLTATSSFQLAANSQSGRVISLNLSRKMRVESATVDGESVEIFQQVDELSNAFNSDAEFLLVLKQRLDASRSHLIAIHYSGNIISQLNGSSYLVGERNLWYPHTETMLTDFDLRFHCPERFKIASTGEAVEERVDKGVRTVHRRTTSPQQMAGFNLGEYRQQSVESPPYLIQLYEDSPLNGNFNGISEQAANILRHYSREWLELSDHTLAITPVPGDFGQGFPGLIYLARTAYLPEADRPAGRRAEQERIFFSDLLLPHEIAHQWWGNMVTPETYRSEWLMEAMANESALEFISQSGSGSITDAVLEQYRTDLAEVINGKAIESSGPVDFGTRIMTTAGMRAWQTVIYKKGTWVLQMLRARMGAANFTRMQAELLRSNSGKPISNEDFRALASRYIPSDQPDKDLELFFETWIYGTGIPKISVNHSGTKLHVSGIDSAFSADVPVRCRTRNGVEQLRWVRITEGDNATPAPGCKLPPRLDFLYFPE